MLPFQLLNLAFDNKMRFNVDPLLIIENFLWRTRSEYAISNHYDYHCVWDEVLQNKRLNTSKDPLHVPNGSMTRSRTKALKEAMNALVLKVSTRSELQGPLEYQEETLVHLIHVQERSNTTLFGP